jgi:hypothetical protein
MLKITNISNKNDCQLKAANIKDEKNNNIIVSFFFSPKQNIN